MVPIGCAAALFNRDDRHEQEIVLMWVAMYMRAWQPMTVTDLWQDGVTVVGGNYSAKIRSLSRRTVLSRSGCDSCRTPAEIHDSACRPWFFGVMINTIVASCVPFSSRNLYQAYLSHV